MGRKKVKYEVTRGNVFLALGFSPQEAENLKVRTELMVELKRHVERHGLSQAEAAQAFGVSQPRISDLLRGRLERFSVDSLIGMLGKAGLEVTFKAKPRPKVA